MPRPNPFLRRASSPGDLSDERKPITPTKITHPSLSDSALRIRRPVTFRHAQTRTMSIRPTRFIKAGPPTPQGDPSSLSEEMQSFVRLFDTYSHKVYLEGYLMKHNEPSHTKLRTKCFAELCGPMLTLWDAESQGLCTPQYMTISDCTVQAIEQPAIDEPKKKKHVFSICFMKKTVVFETSDEMTLLRWVCALRLSCFEHQKLHQLFTLRILAGLPHDPTSRWESYLQVRLPGATEWHKYWAVVTDKRDERTLFGKKTVATRGQFLLYETKKAKTPFLTLTDVQRVYAVYPESWHLIDKSTLMRLEGDIHQPHHKQTQDNVLLMADSSQHMALWLDAMLNAFKLHGRPDQLTDDPCDEKALNYGEPECNQRLFLETEDAIQAMDVSWVDPRTIEHTFLDVMRRKSLALTASPRPPSGRANSLPLITVGDDGRTTNAAEVVLARDDTSWTHPGTVDGSDDDSTTYTFARQVADSSDESEDDDGNDEEEEDDDSDDEPIGKTRQLSRPVSPVPKKSMVEGLIPDFDFGNGFDVPRHVQHRRESESTVEISLPSSDSVEPPTTHSRQLSLSAKPSSCASSASAVTSLFGDFRLATDFTKYLDQPLVKDTPRKTPSKLEEKSESEGEYAKRHAYDDDSLLDTYLGEQLSAKEQIEYARATGQPFIQMPAKPRTPQAGLIGMISQREKDRREGHGIRVTERVHQHQAELGRDRLEREKERRLAEQRQQQLMKHQMMLYATSYMPLPAYGMPIAPLYTVLPRPVRGHLIPPPPRPFPLDQDHRIPLRTPNNERV
ncbi:hypothetical protein CLU79DRAFT_837840 [Phycomyces nitens]|nr:hypothetical protein CLU79DRAFT_837840 [Phycomyces nitens]